MATIDPITGRKVRLIRPWRLLPARFRDAPFHVDAGSRENGRRIVTHEFPKRELPYSEDMGRQAMAFQVRGYCITYPRNNPEASVLYRRNYQIARDLLLAELEKEGDGYLQMPTLPEMKVVVRGYRLSEDEKHGGYCVFDMQFVEQGQPPNWRPNSRDQVVSDSGALRDDLANDLGLGDIGPNN